ncbi:hypothetical protein GYMLUDRAFT_695477 [Collybiopsis luxurians FD-317 M1]|uniref:Uncharacterized protein n=1 Tax=Collybiopsis luxurians FD-317 M1 TaxID=944289 RepID=A0A0D0CJ67_9AGAR|nr:hypothetical protein GYMLUDRAFT_695477 [Collybiopsis luxurians FD-317 M1]
MCVYHPFDPYLLHTNSFLLILNRQIQKPTSFTLVDSSLLTRRLLHWALPDVTLCSNLFIPNCISFTRCRTERVLPPNYLYLTQFDIICKLVSPVHFDTFLLHCPHQTARPCHRNPGYLYAPVNVFSVFNVWRWII